MPVELLRELPERHAVVGGKPLGFMETTAVDHKDVGVARAHVVLRRLEVVIPQVVDLVDLPAAPPP